MVSCDGDLRAYASIATSVAALLDAHVDPNDADKQAALQRLLAP